MAEASKNSRYLASEDIPYIGSVFLDPSQSTVTVKKGVKGEASYQQKSQISYGDKQSRSYGKATLVDKSFSGEFCWKNGKSGVKDEHKKSATVRVGDHNGYTEFYREETTRRVTFDKCSGSNNVVPYGKYRRYDNNNSVSESESEYECESESDSDCGHYVCSYSYDSDSD